MDRGGLSFRDHQTTMRESMVLSNICHQTTEHKWRILNKMVFIYKQIFEMLVTSAHIFMVFRPILKKLSHFIKYNCLRPTI